MSNLEKSKSMPYYIGEGDMEMVKIRCSAAIIAATNRRRSRAKITRWSISIAATVMLFVGVAIGVQGAQSEYDRFIDQLADLPESVLYEMSVDAVEYSEDVYIL